MTKIYRLSGLFLRSELELPIPSCCWLGSVDVEIQLGTVRAGTDLIWQSEPNSFTCSRAGHGIVLEWFNLRFGVTGDRIVIDASDTANAVIPVLQAVWSVLLTARGRESLHASVVGCEGHAIAIAGKSGSGKSTAALALLDRGWSLVADDLLTFDDNLCALPGPPFIRLTHDQAIGRQGTWDLSGKLRYTPARGEYPVPSLPLSAIFIHTEGCQEPEQLFGIAAVHAVLSNVYNDVVTHPGQTARRLQLAFALASRVAIFRVPPRSLTADILERIAGRAVLSSAVPIGIG